MSSRKANISFWLAKVRSSVNVCHEITLHSGFLRIEKINIPVLNYDTHHFNHDLFSDERTGHLR